MAQNSALSTLKDLAEKEVDDAALQLGAMRRGCQQAEEQLKMLIDYQHVDGVPVLTSQYGTINGQYALRVEHLINPILNSLNEEQPK